MAKKTAKIPGEAQAGVERRGFFTPKGKFRRQTAEANAPGKAASKPTEPKPVKFQKRFISIARLTFLSKVNDKDIAESLGVDVETLEWWKEEPPEFGVPPRAAQLRRTAERVERAHISIARTLAELGATDLEIRRRSR